MSERTRSFRNPATEGIHASDAREAGERAVVTPIYQTTTFRFESLDEMARQVRGELPLDLYTRYTHPNLRAVEARIAAMERTEGAVSFGSGMAAMAAVVMTFCAAGDRVVAFDEVYGGTYRLLRDFMSRFGVEATLVPLGDFEALDAAIDGDTKLIIAETPTNPLARVISLDRLAAVGKKHDVLTVVDNTWATPVLQRPCEHGIDMVVHSATKYLGGHSDVMGGFVVGPGEYIEPVRATMKITGGILDPHAAFLLERGMKTLGVRMEQHCRNAQVLAELLDGHPAVSKVHYPGLPENPGHTVAAAQMSGFGGMLSFDLAGGFEAADRFCQALEIGVLAVSLGAVETLVSPPVLTSHVMLSEAERAAQGITDGTLRLSVGIEDTDDLVADLTAALDAVAR